MRTVIFGPIAALASIFVLTWAVAVANRLYGFTSPYAVLGVGTVLFAATTALSTCFGLRQLRAIDQLARSDSLTQLPNRRALHSDIQDEIRQGHEVALAMIDLDGFKLTNDHYGHFVGDAALRQCAEIFKQISDGEARVYRLGGDEYAMMIGGAVAGTLLEGLSRRIIERLAKPIHVEDRRLTIGASIGLARRAPQDDATSSELLRRADIAMYASKRGGKMRCTWFNPAFDQSREQLKEMDDELRSALVNKEFRLHYQPLVDSTTRMIVSAECLMRWDRPDGKRIGPNVFIPVAEESGLINSIGLWVLRQACCDALEWDGISLSVNISAAQLRNPEFPIQLGHILEETGFPAGRLELEITETCLVLDPVVAERSLAVIRGFGVRIALDDFGTGFSTLTQLRTLPFDRVKIDRSFVGDIREDQSDASIINAIVAMARGLKLDLIAEGVENREEAHLLTEIGCDTAQGYYFARPMPEDQVIETLSSWKADKLTA